MVIHSILKKIIRDDIRTKHCGDLIRGNFLRANGVEPEYLVACGRTGERRLLPLNDTTTAYATTTAKPNVPMMWVLTDLPVLYPGI